MSKHTNPDQGRQVQKKTKAVFDEIKYTEQDKLFLDRASKLTTVAKTAIKTLVEEFDALQTPLGAALEPKICHLLHPVLDTVYKLDQVGTALGDALAALKKQEEQTRLDKEKQQGTDTKQ